MAIGAQVVFVRCHLLADCEFTFLFSLPILMLLCPCVVSVTMQPMANRSSVYA